MTAGLNVKARIWRMVQRPDDLIGGAQYSGTVAYSCVSCRLTQRLPSMMLVEQGIETEKVAIAEVRPGSLIILERDEFEIIGPFNHPYYGERWRVIGVDGGSVHPSDSRGSIRLSLSRIVRARVSVP